MRSLSGLPDVVIVGAGIVGLATALAVQHRQPDARILILEKERSIGRHQTGRNSGVIHAGVYYAPGSLKAQFCRDGAARMREFCNEHGIPWEDCGKLIVATDPAELTRMERLYRRARANGIRIEMLDADAAHEAEPNIRAVGALFARDTGIVDFARVAQRMAELFIDRGGEIRFGATVFSGRDQDDGVEIDSSVGSFAAGKAVFCAGLWADRMARIFGAQEDFRIVPFRGEYFRILNQPDDLVRHLIYPVPDPERPFLGVHLTRKMDGGFTVGPNAVLAGARDGYRKFDVNLRELAQAALWPGFWRLIGRNLRPALSELAGSSSKYLYLRKVRKYCPQIGLADLAPYRSGIRAQAVRPDGTLIEDFLFTRSRHSLHVCNAPSPAATASIPIGDHIAQALEIHL